MRFPKSAALVLALAGVAAGPAWADPVPAADADRANQVMQKALANAADIPGQARNLTRLAWPAGPRDEAVAALSRRELVNFGDHSMAALREAFNTVGPAYSEEVLETTLGAQRNARVEFGTMHLSIVLDALWIGSRGAKVLAIDALESNRTLFGVAPMIDSAIDDPTLAPLVVEALGKMRYPHARFYLEKVMMEGPEALRPVAASSLAQIGGAALGPLKNALKAQNRAARLLAARSLLPAATEYDLGALYEYMDKHGDDDPELTQAIKNSTATIEKAIAARDANEAAAGPKDF